MRAVFFSCCNSDILILASLHDSLDFDDCPSVHSVIPAGQGPRAINVLKVWSACAEPSALGTEHMAPGKAQALRKCLRNLAQEGAQRPLERLPS